MSIVQRSAHSFIISIAPDEWTPIGKTPRSLAGEHIVITSPKTSYTLLERISDSTYSCKTCPDDGRILIIKFMLLPREVNDNAADVWLGLMSARRSYGACSRAVVCTSDSLLLSQGDDKYIGIVVPKMDGDAITHARSLMDMPPKVKAMRAMGFLYKCLDALIQLHRMGLHHNGVKPTNFLQSADGSIVKISDIDVAPFASDAELEIDADWVHAERDRDSRVALLMNMLRTSESCYEPPEYALLRTSVVTHREYPKYLEALTAVTIKDIKGWWSRMMVVQFARAAREFLLEAGFNLPYYDPERGTYPTNAFLPEHDREPVKAKQLLTMRFKTGPGCICPVGQNIKWEQREVEWEKIAGHTVSKQWLAGGAETLTRELVDLIEWWNETIAVVLAPKKPHRGNDEVFGSIADPLVNPLVASPDSAARPDLEKLWKDLRKRSKFLFEADEK
jgi:hypothetical protein